MFCPKCGEKNPEDARFCGKCGAPLPAGAPSQASSSGYGISPASAAGDASSAIAPNVKVLGTIGAIVIPFLGIVLGIVFMNDPHPAKKSLGRRWLFLGIGMIFVWGLIGACAEALQGGNANW
jgi:uncharacterized membrane protein YvbJ